MFALIVSLFAIPSSTQAASCSGAMTVSNIQPTSISNVSAVEIVIAGSGFTANTVVTLGSVGVLDSTFTDSDPPGNGIITAKVPAGVAAGSYTLTLIDPDNGQTDCASAITISAPPNPSATSAPTNTPAPTSTPAPTNFIRPVIAVDSYGASSAKIDPGQDLDFDVTLVNWGQLTASNIILTFAPGDFSPRLTGGQRVVGALDPGQKVKVYQPLTASKGLSGKSVATLEVKADYTDASGKPYSETFTLTFPVVQAGAAATNTPTPTATLSARPQLLVRSYVTDPAILQPGARFSLTFEVLNTGAANAKRITMILGGGSVNGGSGGGGTPGVGGSGGGVSGAGGDFSNFAPLDTSNVQFIGDINAAQTVSLKQNFIVNASAKAGAFPMKISFAYTDEGGTNFNDDQTITLLVQAPPVVEISFYRPPDPFFVGQPGSLPIQIVNKSRATTLLGNMTVTSAGAEMSNNTILVGNLDAGGSFPLDAVAIPSQPGSLEFTVTVDYIDDFNQPQSIVETLTVEVTDIPTPEPGLNPGGEFPPPTEPESAGQLFLRFIAGFLGFDSAPPQSVAVFNGIPTEGEVINVGP
jgi:hypothetical protein